jgi:uncharacterized repeat protein (TIGR03803 family)
MKKDAMKLRMNGVLVIAALAVACVFCGFKASANAAGWVLTPLVSFNAKNGGGAYPQGTLISDASGNLYGTTYEGGLHGYGTVFELKKTSTGTGYASTPTILLNFADSNGANPEAGLVRDAAGDLLGTTFVGGANKYGTVFELKKTSTGTGYAPTPSILSFDGNNGANPVAGLAADAAGNLYGTTEYGGLDFGTVFELIKQSGGNYSFTTLWSFLPNFGVFSDNVEAYPAGGLVLNTAGDIFGTTTDGATTSACDPSFFGYCGSVFELVNQGGGNYSLTTWYNLESYDGETPLGGLIINSGFLLGTTYTGTTTADGSVFAIQAPSSISYVSFEGTSDGANPRAGLVANAAGDLFGTTVNGGAYGYGTVFEMAKTSATSWSAPTVLFSFDNNINGFHPFGGLFVNTAGDLFGTTNYGGAYGYGTVFELKP